MVVHDEETIEGALLLLRERDVVRYVDQYAYILISDPLTLEDRCQAAVGRGDIAVVVPKGMEPTLENYDTELRRVRERRKKQEAVDIREYFHEHPDKVDKVRKYLKKEEGSGES